ncbi:hypothetical protein B0H14DRAFT_2893231, partial [Mycena olivaceomarginata]
PQPLTRPVPSPAPTRKLISQSPLERLEQLRQNVQKNLRLRPIRSNGSLPKVQLGDTSPWDPSINSPQSMQSSSESTPPPVPQRKSQPIEPGALFQRLSAPRRPLLDRHSAARRASCIPHPRQYQSRHPFSDTQAFEKTPFQSLDALRQYITTEKGKRDWDILLKPGGPWDNDIVVYSEDEDKTLLPVLAPLLSYGNCRLFAGRHLLRGPPPPDLQTLILSDSDNHERNSGLFQLDNNAAFPVPRWTCRPLTLTCRPPRSPLPPPRSPLPPPRSPLPLMSSIMSSTSVETGINIVDGSPSPPPSQAGFRRPPPPPRRPSAPNLRKLDTKSAERLKLSVRPVPSKSLNSLSLSLPPPSPHPAISATSPSTPWSLTSPISGNDEFPTRGANGFGAFPFGRGGDPPPTARPDDPPTTEEPMGEFAISTILPHFLFLGPELTNPEHVTELQALGEFERYNKIPMRDTVEEENIARGVREDDARLHSAATYVHCKAGKSRSVTAGHGVPHPREPLTLSRAYARRSSAGRASACSRPRAPTATTTTAGPARGTATTRTTAVAAGGRRGGHVRESLPPAFSQTQSFSAAPDNQDFGPGVGGGVSEAVGNAGQEMEVRDAAGRYRHARRAPVDENTLQPMRRVSKAGLESSAYGLGYIRAA